MADVDWGKGSITINYKCSIFSKKGKLKIALQHTEEAGDLLIYIYKLEKKDPPQKT